MTTTPTLQGAPIEPEIVLPKMPEAAFIQGEAGRNSVRWPKGYTATTLEGYARAAILSDRARRLAGVAEPVALMSDDEIQWEISEASTNPAWLDVEYGKRIEAVCRKRAATSLAPVTDAPAILRNLLCELGSKVQKEDWRLAERAFAMSTAFGAAPAAGEGETR